jgi:hypothetical protein
MEELPLQPRQPVDTVVEDKINKKPHFTWLLILITVLITAIAGSSGFYFYHSKIIQEKDINLLEKDDRIQELFDANEQLNTDLENVKLEVDKLMCVGVWDEEEGCVISKLIVITPRGGEDYCIGDNIPVKWSGPADMETVTIWLYTANGNRNNLGEHKAVKNIVEGVGYGEINWRGMNVIGQPMQPKDIYKIDVITRYENETLTGTSKGIFSLRDCKEI